MLHAVMALPCLHLLWLVRAVFNAYFKCEKNVYIKNGRNGNNMIAPTPKPRFGHSFQGKFCEINFSNYFIALGTTWQMLWLLMKRRPETCGSLTTRLKSLSVELKFGGQLRYANLVLINNVFMNKNTKEDPDCFSLFSLARTWITFEFEYKFLCGKLIRST